MNHKRLWVAATIIAVVVLAGFVLSVPHTRDIKKVLPVQDEETRTPPVTLHDSFKKGVHTITGSIETPNACANIAAQANLVGEGIVVAVSMPADTGVCLQLPTRTTFSTTIAAPAGLPLSATVNGAPATTTAS